MKHYDVVIATDLRFPGGSSGSTLEEINAQHRAGLRTAVYPMRASILNERPRHPGFAAAAARGACEILEPGEEVATKLLLFRHPTVIDHHGAALPKIAAETVALIVNHPPINAAARMDYLLPYVRRRLRLSYGMAPKLYPIGPLVRAAVEKYYDRAPLLEPEDWPSIFDLSRFAAQRGAPRDPIRIGRHSRPDPEKWPATREDILGAWPERDDVEVRILGGAQVPEGRLGRLPRNWTVYPFGSRPAEAFLREIDIFVYYHHPRWIEAFGRTIIEAMASGLPLILPPHFAPLCGEAALYSDAKTVLTQIARLRDPVEYRARSERAAAFARGFSADIHIARLARLGVGANPAA